MHIIQRYRDLSPESLLALTQENFWRHDGSIEPSIFGGVIKMTTLRRIILEVGDYIGKMSLVVRQLSGVLDK